MKRLVIPLLITLLFLGFVFTDVSAGRDMPNDKVYRPQGLLFARPLLGLFPLGRIIFPFGPLGPFILFNGRLNQHDKYKGKKNAEAGVSAP
ncbi:unnamed protein product [Amaranthus hypochondriacus]